MKHKKLAGSIILVVLLLLGILLVSSFAVGWNNSSDLHAFLGERYLDALDYEQAIAAFEQAINIDPKNEDAYRMLAETYDKMGMEAKAAEVLRNGYIATASRELRDLADDDYEVDVTKPIITVQEEDRTVVKQVGLDVCFVIDTTGSMSGAISNARENMSQIIDSISEKSSDYRIAIVDYRDFASRSGDWTDYPAKLQLDFCSDRDKIQEGIDGLSLGNGGDGPETVYSGLMLAASLDWRRDAQHVVILIGDAEPLSPEPITGYTYDDVKEAFRAGSAEVDLDSYIYESYEEYESATYGGITGDASYGMPSFDSSDATVMLLSAKDSEMPVGETTDAGNGDSETTEETDAVREKFNINLYGIATDPGWTAEKEFRSMCEDMGGSLSTVGSDTTLAEEICGIIEQVEVVPVSRDATVNFGEEYAGQEIMVYRGSQIMNKVSLNASGKGTLRDIQFGTYLWRSTENGAFGYLTVSADEEKAKITTDRQPNADRVVMIELIVGASISVVLIVLIAVLIIKKRAKKVKTAEKQTT